MIPKSPSKKDRPYLDRLRELPCLVTGRLNNPDIESVVPAHFRWGTNCGTGMKPSDWFANPLLHSEHEKQGRDEEQYWIDAVTAEPLILRDFIRDALKWRYFERTGKVPGA